jgi:hypothetical protein
VLCQDGHHAAQYCHACRAISGLSERVNIILYQFSHTTDSVDVQCLDRLMGPLATGRVGVGLFMPLDDGSGVYYIIVCTGTCFQMSRRPLRIAFEAAAEPVSRASLKGLQFLAHLAHFDV